MKSEWNSIVKIALCVTLPVALGAYYVHSTSDRTDAANQASGKSSTRQMTANLSLTTIPLVEAADLEELRALARTDANSARKLAAHMGPEAVVAVAVALASTDLAATEAWARTLKEPLHDAAFSALVSEIAPLDPEAAFRLARQIDEFEPRQQMMAHALAQLAATDPQLAWDTLQKAAISSERIALERIVLAAVAEQDPLTVADWLARKDTPPELVHSLTVTTAQRWTQQDPQAAAAWISRLPESPARQQATEALMQVWASSDPAAATAWLAKEPTGLERDEMAFALGSALAGRDRTAAQAMVATIGDESIRTRLRARLDLQPTPTFIDNGQAAGDTGTCHGE